MAAFCFTRLRLPLFEIALVLMRRDHIALYGEPDTISRSHHAVIRD
jgi:hypothetical protein